MPPSPRNSGPAAAGRIRFRPGFLAVVLLLLAARVAGQVAPGMREADLLALKGAPVSTVAAGPKVIYGWPDMQVVVVDGVVAKVMAREGAAGAPGAAPAAKPAAAAQAPRAASAARVPDALARARSEFVRSESGKQIWARSVLGQPAPALVVQKWLTPKPPVDDGKFRVIDFWATWCGPCRRAIPELNQICRQFADRVDVIGISDEAEPAVRAMRDPAIEYYVGIDTLARTKGELAVTGIPHVIIVDPSGIVRWEGFPLLQGHELSAGVVQRVLDLYSN
jgi:thiol-disulfide isomerase/thioredoxin